MCGIFGVINSTARHARGVNAFMADAFIASGVRGTDSAGMFQIDEKKDVYYQKQHINGILFLEDKSVKAMLDDVNKKGVSIGHVRKATEGKIKRENAHPFFSQRDEDKHYVVGVHNGTLNNWRSHANAFKFDVDSEWAMNYIFAKKEKAFNDLKGAYAFVYYDTREPDSLKIIRNAERPLYYAFAQSTDNQQNKTRQKTLLISSEYGMLTWLANRNTVEIENKVYQFEPEYLYEIDLSDVTSFKKTKVIEEKKANPTTPSTDTTTQTTSGDSTTSRGSSCPYNYGYVGSKETMLKNIRTALKGEWVFPITALSRNQPDDNVISYARTKGYVTVEEETNAKDLKELGDEYNFSPMQWDEKENSILGAVDVITRTGKISTFEAILKGVPVILAKQLVEGKFTELSARVAGVRYAPIHEKSDVYDIIYIMVQPTVKNIPKVN